MKKYFNKYLVFAVAGVLSLASCEDSELLVDTVTDGVTRGAALRTVNLISNELPIGDNTAQFAADFEIQDIEGGILVDNINVYVAFSDNTVESGAQDLDVAEALFATISSADFTQGPFGLPRTSFSVTLTEMLQFVGRSEADLFGGDFFPIRFELVLNDGRTFSSTNSNANNLGGSFYSSPFIYFPTVICPIPETAFVGTYTVNVNPGSGPGGGVPIWAQDLEVEVGLGETSTQRTFEAVYLPTLGIGNGPSAFTFDLVCGGVVVPGEQASGLACAGNSINFGPSISGEQGAYDINDDSSLTVIFNEDSDNGCGGGPDATATLVKN